jgi:tetratricopeptide (TPR) repeat protein
MPTAPTVFISYSHKDKVWKDRLLTHLQISEKEGLLELWDDRRIAAGTEWHSEIQTAIDAADIGILLISADFLVSDFIRGEEIPRMLERRSKNGMRLFPVMVRSCDWQIVSWLAPIQIRPTGARPLAGFGGNRRDEEMAAIAQEIRGILDSEAVAPAVPQAALSTLHQLPTPPADFTGREEDLNFLRSRLAEGGTGAIFGLRGMGGVGKTTLALKLASELKPRFPDAQIYLDLKGVGPQPLTVAQAMAHVIRAFNPEARLLESEAELAGMYRSVLEGRRTLLLMDNAAKREQIELLIPPSTCLLLVTSRFRFALPGLIARNLDEMPEKDARDLLLRISSRISDTADEIARLCGRLPLALRLAGSNLAERPNLSPSEYGRRLREGKEHFTEVEASLNLSYEFLDEERRQLWRILAVFPGSFDGSAAAAVWELTPDYSQDVLGELVRSSLVEWEEKEKRYHLHDLSRVFADGRLEASEREACQRRHAEHFLRVLGAVNTLFLQGGTSIHLALKVFDTEWSNIQAGQSWAASHAQEDNAANRICADYPNAGSYILSLRQHIREQIRWREFGLAAARRCKDKRVEGNHLGNLGNGYKDLGETQRAIEFYKQALVIGREIGDRRGEGNALGSLGLAYADLGKTRSAIKLYKQTLIINREIGDQRGESNSLGNLGRAYAALGENRRAIKLYEQALIIDREIGNRSGEGADFVNLGLAYNNLGETPRSIDLYKQALIIDREIGDKSGESVASWNLGLALEREGDLAQAADLMQFCVDYELEIDHPNAEKDAAYLAALRARIADAARD